MLEGVDADGDLLDVGCANGYLLECLVHWGRERGRVLTPHGIDLGPRLIGLAKARHPGLAANFHAADIHDWHPPRRYRFVYSIVHVVPESLLVPYARGLLDRVVAPGGRLILGAYGSRSASLPPFDVAGHLASHGVVVAGHAVGGDPPLTAFAWVARP